MARRPVHKPHKRKRLCVSSDDDNDEACQNHPQGSQHRRNFNTLSSHEVRHLLLKTKMVLATSGLKKAIGEWWWWWVGWCVCERNNKSYNRLDKKSSKRAAKQLKNYRRFLGVLLVISTTTNNFPSRLTKNFRRKHIFLVRRMCCPGIRRNLLLDAFPGVFAVAFSFVTKK